MLVLFYGLRGPFLSFPSLNLFCSLILDSPSLSFATFPERGLSNSDDYWSAAICR